MSKKIPINYPDPEVISEMLSHGYSYSQAIDKESNEDKNNQANFKLNTIDMSDNRKERSKNSDKLSIDQINKDNFEWRTGDGAYSLEEMDLHSCLAAAAHFIGKQDENYNKYTKLQKGAEQCYQNVQYFIRLQEIIEEHLAEHYGIDQIPNKKSTLKEMRHMIDEGIMKIEADKRSLKERKNDSQSD